MIRRSTYTLFAIAGLAVTSSAHGQGDDGYFLDRATCTILARDCTLYYSAQGYASPVQCFDDISQGECPPPGTGQPTTGFDAYQYYEAGGDNENYCSGRLTCDSAPV